MGGMDGKDASSGNSVAVLSEVEVGSGVGSRVAEALIEGVGDAGEVVGTVELAASVGRLTVGAGSLSTAQDVKRKLERTRMMKGVLITIPSLIVSLHAFNIKYF